MSRPLLLVPALAAVALAGCTYRGDAFPRSSRGADAAPASADTARSAANPALEQENAELRARLEEARKRLAEGKGANAGGTVADDVAAISGGEIEGFERTAGGGVALPDDLAFAKGSATLTEAGEKAIGRLATRLNEGANRGHAVLVVGHTDASPVSRPATKEKFVDNWGLSAARSAAVVRALEHNGVDAKRLQGGFRGEHQPRGEAPAKAGDKKTAQADDRRVEIYLK